MSRYIDIQQVDRVLQIHLNRPDKKNALDLSMYQTLADTLTAADKNPDVSVIYLSAVGDAFCSGNDLKDFLENTPENNDAPVFQFMHAIANAQKPVVAAVTGLAVGIGTTMLLHCDLVYADETSKFMLPFVKLGVCAEAGSSFLLPMLFGHQKAAEILLCGEGFGAQEAKEAGFVSEVVESEVLQQMAYERAALLTKQPPNALMATKKLMKQPFIAQVNEAIKVESAQFLELLQQDESKQIMAAFLNR